MNEKIVVYESYIEMLEVIEGEMHLKTEGKNLEKALKVLDIIRDGSEVRVREALDRKGNKSAETERNLRLPEMTARY